MSPIIILEDLTTLEKGSLSIQKVTPLQTSAENLMGTDIRVRFDQSFYYLMDENSKDGIHQFNGIGDYLGIIAPIGDGPEKFIKLDDFFINADGSIEILSGIGDQATIYKISPLREIDQVFQINYLASSFTTNPSGEYLLYGSYNLPFTQFRLVKTDPKGNTISSFLENTYTNNLLPMTERNFFQNQNNLYVIESFQPYVYQFQNDSLESVAQLDFGRYAIPAYFWQEDIMDSFGKMSESGFANLHGVFEDETLRLLSVHFQKPEGIFKEVVITEKSTGKTVKLSSNLTDDMLYHYPIGVEDGELLFLTYRSVILDGLPKSDLDKIQMEIPQQEFDYPVIIKAKIRFNE